MLRELLASNIQRIKGIRTAGAVLKQVLFRFEDYSTTALPPYLSARKSRHAHSKRTNAYGG